MTYSTADFALSPMLVFYEVTRACDLACLHCRACAQPLADPRELSTDEAQAMIRQLATFPCPPLLVFTGGDPIKRGDILDLVKCAAAGGLEAAMTPSATPLLTDAVIARLSAAGLRRLALSLDGADAATHDGFRGVAGSFDRTMAAIPAAHAARLPVQINTTVSRYNAGQIDAIAALLADLNIVLWSVFFLVPVGRGQAQQRLSAEECEAVFEKLHVHSQRQPYAIKTTEAPHYRRYLLQHRQDAGRPAARSAGTNDGKGVMFVSHTGELFPSGFLPILCGQFPQDSVVEVYQNSPVFRSLRDADQLKGKCGQCEYRRICGGSRARSYAISGDWLAAEPDCIHIPRGNTPLPGSGALSGPLLATGFTSDGTRRNTQPGGS